LFSSFYGSTTLVGLGFFHEVHDHTQIHYSRLDSSGCGSGPSQGPLPGNTQHSHETGIHAPMRSEPAIPASEQPQTHTFDSTATGVALLST